MMENRIGIMMMREMIGINVVDTILGMMMMMKVITPTRVGNVIMRMIRVIAKHPRLNLDDALIMVRKQIMYHL